MTSDRLDVDDVKQILFELYLAQRDAGRLRAVNEDLTGQLAALRGRAATTPDSEEVPG